MTSSSSSINEAAGIKGMSLFLSVSPLLIPFFMLVIIGPTSTTQGIWTEDSLVLDLVEKYVESLRPSGSSNSYYLAAMNRYQEVMKNPNLKNVTVRLYRVATMANKELVIPEIDAAIKEFIDDPLQHLRSGNILFTFPSVCLLLLTSLF